MLNHNGGPRRLTDKEFRTLVKTIVLSRLSGHQKLLSISVAAVADEDGQAVLGAEDMKRVCSVQKRDTVFAAKRDIAEDGLGIIATVSQAGRPNKYHVMPPRVVASIIEAYHARIDAGGQPIPKKETSPVPKNGTGDVHEKGTTPIPETGTSPVPRNGTSPEKGDGSRARVDDNIYNKNNNLTLSHQEPARESEQHVGHGVYVNCDVIRHREFSISVSGIAMRSQASGLTTEEIKTKLTGIALQWAVEIENGRPASEVVPKVVTSALARAIMSDRNQDDIHHLRKSKAAGQRTTVSTGKTVDEMYSDWRTSQ